MKNLVIVESPTKARTISRYLGDGYTIKFSMGHVMDLPKSTLSVDVEHNFKPEYEVIPDKKKIIAELKTAAKSASTIILATDPDREGEAIASNIKDVLRSSEKLPARNASQRDAGGKVKSQKFARIVFHEITEHAIKEALEHPRGVDHNLVEAQTARRVLDRLVGYKLSPVLWQKVRRGLSAGRVQSVALRLIVEREKEIEKFNKEPYFTIHALFEKVKNKKNVILVSESASWRRTHPESPSAKRDAGPTFAKATMGKQASMTKESGGVEFELIEIKGEKLEEQTTHELYDGQYKITKTTITTEKKAESIVADIKKNNFFVADVLQKETRRSPFPPYTTSTLQQDASRRFGYPGKRTMSLAQKLYEEGFITYHRTDSVVIAAQAMNQIRNYIEKQYGGKYLPEKPRFYTTKQKLAQEAHEGIRPTHVNRLNDDVAKELGKEHAKLYDLIWRRAVSSQMGDAIVESTTVYADSSPVILGSEAPYHLVQGEATPGSDSGQAPMVYFHRDPDIIGARMTNNYRFKANGSVLLFDGFLKVNPLALQDTKLPKFEKDEDLKTQSVRQEPHETPPPPRYNDASLIGTLEDKGIGRPSTYASIIATLTDRGYVERVERRFEPTSVGIAVNDFLVANFSDIDDIPFTAQMEDDLDEVANGNKEWVKMMKEFYNPFEKQLEKVKDAKRVKIEVEKTDEKCPVCKKANLVVRTGRFGKFLSCARFPDCKFTKPLLEETNLACPQCGHLKGNLAGKVVIKKTRKGRRFYGCSNYPNCDFAAWKLEDIKGYKKPKEESSEQN
ncbi:MAG: type I DNA topoisomerase [Candidatus Levybacteria bacterium]|nr:type I DNA topoisomerase [Candidatus Levybacteria bacterium]